MTSFWSKAAAAAAQSPAGSDVIQADFRAEPSARPSIRRDPPPTPAALVATDDLLRLRLAEEVDYARRMLDALGNRLSGDANVIARHANALQSLDVVGQLLGHLADIIRSSDPDVAVERLGMEELKARLTRKNLL